ncbi:hypothetical protein GCM10025867_48610 (plasmid) [Frondihabitans sucicola]|uniref:Uncharacterized protein n=1 Tax=Frondihabitans sucicola TaxID=1268041 RepID=A0ABN6Y9L9_9MICO|nr:hypothetical protein [Frondihabitans sucicola]BDZ52620.1 hypothetical protein GCM10025867_48610 [Frondihabitans sucicola]
MCRACDDANPRRCPSSSGPLRSARDRSAYAAKKAAGLTKPRRKHGPTAGHDVKGGLDAPAVKQPPTVEELNAMIAEVQHAYQGSVGVPESDPEAYFAMIEKYGSREGAVVALGTAIAERAEMHAGVTADEVEALQQANIERIKTETPEMTKRLRIDETRVEIARNHAALEEARRAGDETRAAELTAKYWELARVRDAAWKDPQYLELKELQNQAQNYRKGPVGDKLRSLADGYQKTLAEVRPMGGDMAFHERSTKKAAASFNVAAQFYPSDWIDASNSRPPAIAKIVKSRAHYFEGATQTTKKRKPVETLYFASADVDLSEDNGVYREYIPHPEKDGYGDRAWIRKDYDVHTKSGSWGTNPAAAAGSSTNPASPSARSGAAPSTAWRPSPPSASPRSPPTRTTPASSTATPPPVSPPTNSATASSQPSPASPRSNTNGGTAAPPSPTAPRRPRSTSPVARRASPAGPTASPSPTPAATTGAPPPRS